MTWRLLDQLWTRLGLKTIEADYYARVNLERWFLFGYEHGDDRAMPNAFVTRYAGQPHPAETAHSHPWSSLAIILCGKYVEIVNGTERRVTRRFSLLTYKDHHRFESVEPGTISLFLHWRRRSTWSFFPVKCASVCAVCAESNAGVCAKPPTDFSWDEKDRLAPDWRVSKWFRADDQTALRLARRRRALERLGVDIPKFKTATDLNDKVVTQFIKQRRDMTELTGET